MATVAAYMNVHGSTGVPVNNFSAITSGDFNNDAKTDFATGSSQGLFSVFEYVAATKTYATSYTQEIAGGAVIGLTSGLFDSGNPTHEGVAILTASAITMLESDGSGTAFATVPTGINLSTDLGGKTPVAITEGHLFGTTFLDLAVLTSDGNILLYKGGANDAFTKQTSPTALTGASFVGLAAGYFDNKDANVDLAAVTATGGLTVLQGDGAGAFTAQTPVALNLTGVVGVATGATTTVTGNPATVVDQKLDILSSNGTIQVVKQDANGVLNTKDATIASRIASSTAIASNVPATPVLNTPDLFIAASPPVNTAAPTVNVLTASALPPPAVPAAKIDLTQVLGSLAKVDNSGKAGTIIASKDGTIRIGKGDGVGNFAYATAPAYINATPLAWSVFIRDNGTYSDVAVIDSKGNLSVFLGDGNDGFVTTSPKYTVNVVTPTSTLKLSAVVSGVFTNGGHTDLAVLESTGTIRIYKGAGDGTFTLATTITPPNGLTGTATGIAAGVFKAAGQSDLAVSYSDGKVVVYENLQAAVTKTIYDAGAPINANAIVADTFLGKTFADIAVLTTPTTGTDQLVVLVNDQAGSFQTPAKNKTTDTGLTGLIQLISGDFDNDGKRDLAFVNPETAGAPAQVDVALGNGDGTFTPPVNLIATGAAGPVSVLSGDVNGDTYTDLGVMNGGTVATFLASTTAPKVSVTNVTQYEGDPTNPLKPTFSTPFNFVFTLDATPLRIVTLTVNTVDVTAKGGANPTSGIDYQAITNGTVTFSGQASESATLTVFVKADYVIEAALRTFTIQITNQANTLDITGVTGANAPTGTIKEDDSTVVNTNLDPALPATDTTIISLRKAIFVANATNADPTYAVNITPITFNLPANSVIKPTTPLPPITGNTTLDGTLPGSGKIEIDGANAGANADGLDLTSYQLTPGDGTQSTTADGSTIESVYIHGFKGDGILVDTGTLIASQTPTTIKNSDISSNIGDGVLLSTVSGSVAPLVTKNTIDTNRKNGIESMVTVGISGNGIVSNRADGVLLENLAGGSNVTGNTVNTNGKNGIESLVDVTITGNTVESNTNDGILINTGVLTASTTITTISGNVVSGNRGDGVDIKSANTLITGNTIGLRLGGLVPFSNGLYGVQYAAGTANQTLGGTGSTDGNTISANGKSLTGTGAANVLIATSGMNPIYGNKIGSDKNGHLIAGSLPVNVAGIVVDVADAKDLKPLVIGGTETGQANQIVGNTGDGIFLVHVSVPKDRPLVIGNTIEDNTQHGIESKVTVDISRNTIDSNRVDGVLLEDQAGRSTVTANMIRLNVANGLEILVPQVIALGNAIQANTLAGVFIHGSDATGNSIGYILGPNDPVGVASGNNDITGNLDKGVVIAANANDNYIQGNLLHGNNNTEILIIGSDGNRVLGNAIGDPTTVSQGHGVILSNASVNQGDTGNQIGAADTQTLKFSNAITHYRGSAVILEDGTQKTTVYGNSITNNGVGLEITGNSSSNVVGLARPGQTPGTGFGNVITDNTNLGVLIDTGSNDNEIHANLISGNANANVTIDASSGNHVQGNLIGTDSTGFKAYPTPSSYGVVVSNGSSANLIGYSNGSAGNQNGNQAPTLGSGLGNLISGNTQDGVLIESGSTGNSVFGDLIGTDSTGTKAILDQKGADIQQNGVEINGASSNFIGSPVAGFGNLISGNAFEGVLIVSNATSNTVDGNQIGTDQSGQVALPNRNGVFVDNASSNIIGGGTSLAGTGAGNLISGNSYDGIYLTGGAKNQVSGNLIGTDSNGSTSLPNVNNGIEIIGSSTNLIGGSDPSQGNVISGNGDRYLRNAAPNASDNSGVGVAIIGGGSTSNTVSGNIIGLTRDGTATVKVMKNSQSESWVGVLIEQGAGNNTVSSNVISGNIAGGVMLFDINPIGTLAQHLTNNQVVNNNIGLAVGGTTRPHDGSQSGSQPNPLPYLQENGILIQNASNSLIQGNTISGNGNATPAAPGRSNERGTGVYITSDGAGAASSNNQVIGNGIGTNKAGLANDPSQPPLGGSVASQAPDPSTGNLADGVYINNSPNNRIGGPNSEANYIVGNGGNGIHLYAGGTVGNVLGTNYIGIDKGRKPAGNNLFGILIDFGGRQQSNTIDPRASQTSGAGIDVGNNGGVNIRIVTANEAQSTPAGTSPTTNGVAVNTTYGTHRPSGLGRAWHRLHRG